MTRRLLALATAALLLVAGAALQRGVGDDDDDSGPPAGPATTVAAPTSLATAVRELQDFVAEARGLAFETDVEVTLLEDGPFQERLLADAEEDRPDIEVTARVLRAVGLLEGDVDLYDVLLQFLGAAVVGFYDPETDELVVRGGELTPARRSTLVHELTHALDDQRFDLHRPELDEGADDERSLAFSALVEGDAVRVESAYRESRPAEEQAEAHREEQELAAGIDLEGLPPVIPRIIGFPYLHGPGFVSALLEAGGEEAVNRAFERPPVTSEHILDPASWLAGEPAREVSPPAAGGPVLDEGVYGQASLALTLEPVLGTRAAAQAADGWGGDGYVVWDGGDGRTCVRARFAMDDADQLAELDRALRLWAPEVGATVERAGATVGFRSCDRP